MASCCWSRGAPDDLIVEEFWGKEHNGWIDFTQSLDIEKVFSGVPVALQGAEGVQVWRVLNEAVKHFAAKYRLVHHKFHFDSLAFLRSYYLTRTGGQVPFIILVVPDYYMKYVTPKFKDKFGLTGALDFGGNINLEIPKQIQDGLPYFIQWRTWRDTTPGLGVPDEFLPGGSISDDDIDIQLAYIWSDRLERAGGTYSLRSHFISQFGGLCLVEFDVDIPRKSPDFSGLVVPVLFLSREDFLNPLRQPFDSVNALRLAGPAPGFTDVSWLHAMNRFYPLSTDQEVRVLINRNEVAWSRKEYEDPFAVSNMHSLLDYIPIQQWSAPDGVQEVPIGSTIPPR